MTNSSSEGNHGRDFVDIVVDGTNRQIHRGRNTIAEIKQVGQVPAGYDLDQIVDGQLSPLADDASVTIKGGETFQSHPKDGASS